MYLTAVEDAFGAHIDYAMLVKHYGSAPEGEKRYSPRSLYRSDADGRHGKARPEAHLDELRRKAKLTMRMGMRRFTRLTNAFSRKIDNHRHSIAMHFMYYNFVRIHGSLRTTPAMAAGVTDTLWSIEDMVRLVD